jgi:hypothetical protein
MLEFPKKIDELVKRQPLFGHMTHLDNVPSIINKGILTYALAERTKLAFGKGYLGEPTVKTFKRYPTRIVSLYDLRGKENWRSAVHHISSDACLLLVKVPEKRVTPPDTKLVRELFIEDEVWSKGRIKPKNIVALKFFYKERINPEIVELAKKSGIAVYDHEGNLL